MLPPPLCYFGRRFEQPNGKRRPFFWPSPNFPPKTGLNLSEDLIFKFWFSPNFGRKTDWFWSSLISNFLNFLATSFENSVYAAVCPWVRPLNLCTFSNRTLQLTRYGGPTWKKELQAEPRNRCLVLVWLDSFRMPEWINFHKLLHLFLRKNQSFHNLFNRRFFVSV